MFRIKTVHVHVYELCIRKLSYICICLMNNFSHLQQVLKIVFLHVTVYIHFNTLSSIFVALIK